MASLLTAAAAPALQGVCKNLLLHPSEVDGALTDAVLKMLRKEVEMSPPHPVSSSVVRLMRLRGLVMTLSDASRPTICFRIVVHLLYKIASLQTLQADSMLAISIDITNMILAIVDACPEALSERDDSGNTALHHACTLNSARPIIESFLSHKPDSPSVLNNYKYNCVHVMLDNVFSVDLLEMIVTRCPESLRKGTDAGKLPIHTLIAKHINDSDQVPLTLRHKVLSIFIGIDPELLFCEFRSELYSIRFTNIGESSLVLVTDTWSPLSKSYEVGNELIKNEVERILSQAALRRAFGPVM